MENGISMAELKGEIEALKATQMAMLVTMGAHLNIDMKNLAAVARNFSKISNATGEAHAAMLKQLAAIDALAELPNR